MLKNFWMVAAICSAGVCTDHEAILKVDRSVVDEYYAENHNGSVIYTLYSCPNVDVDLFINSLRYGDVVFSITSGSSLRASNVFKDFPTVCFQSARYQDAFYFVPARMEKDAVKALSLFSNTSPGFYAYLIPVKDHTKFAELICKTSAGCANKSGEWDRDVSWKRMDEIYSSGLSMLDRQRISYAAAAPSQGSDQKNGSWSCGPNSGFRALRILGENHHNYNEFVSQCPRSISKDGMEATGAGLAFGGGFLGIILAPFTGGLSLIPAGVAFAAGVSSAAVGASISSDVGPGPERLAAYLTFKMKNYRAKLSRYYSQVDYEKSISDDIIRCRYPRIVLIVSGTTNMHYVTIVGVRISGEYISEAVILDTDGKIGIISDSKLQHWLDRDGYAYLILDGRYNTIEFLGK